MKIAILGSGNTETHAQALTESRLSIKGSILAQV